MYLYLEDAVWLASGKKQTAGEWQGGQEEAPAVAGVLTLDVASRAVRQKQKALLSRNRSLFFMRKIHCT